jgi:hypothetical protein
MTNLDASLDTALARSIMIAAVTTFLANIQQSSAIPDRAKSQAQVELAGGAPFVSDADLEEALDEAGVRSRAADDALDAYRDAGLSGLRSALGVLAVMALIALFLAQLIPTHQPGRAEA